MNLRSVLPLAALLLAACQPTENVGPMGDVYVIPPPPDPCGARGVQFLKGRPETALKGRRYAAPLRILRPGDEISPRDVDPNRLTVTLSDSGRIVSLVCG